MPGYFSVRAKSKPKDAIALIVDIGPSMKEFHRGDDKITVMDLAKQCLIQIIEQKIFSQSTNEYILILMGSEGSVEDEVSGGIYHNIRVVDGLKVANLRLLKEISMLQPTDYQARLSDAMVVASQALVSQTMGKTFANRKIGLLTNFSFKLNEEEVYVLVNSFIKNHNIQINLICDYTIKELEEGKNICDTQHEVIKLLKTTDSRNLVFSFKDAIENMVYMEPKPQNSAPCYTKLEIGKNINLSVVGYIKTTEHTKRRWSKAYIDPDEPEDKSDSKVPEIKEEPLDEGFQDLGGGGNLLDQLNDESDEKIAPVVSKSITYLTQDQARLKLDKDDITKGYMFGKTIVPITPEDEAAMKYKSDRKGLQVLFFTPADNVRPYFLAGKSSMVFLPDHRSKELAVQTSFNALAATMLETGTVAVVTFKRAVSYNPQIGFLKPTYMGKSIVMVYSQLAFAEDIRYYKFPPLRDPKKRPQDVPSSDELDLVDDLIQLMSLVETKPNGDTIEYLRCEDIHDPYDRNQFKAIVHRYLHPDKPMPSDIDGDDFLSIPDHIQKRCQPVVDKIKEAFHLQDSKAKRIFVPSPTVGAEEVPTKKIKAEDIQDAEENNGATSSSTEETNGNNNNHKGSAIVDEELKKYETEILDFSKNLLGFNDSKIVKSLESYRIKCIEKKTPESFNQFLRKFKEIVSRRSAWKLIVKKGISLITKEESEASDVNEDEYQLFLKS